MAEPLSLPAMADGTDRDIPADRNTPHHDSTSSTAGKDSLADPMASPPDKASEDVDTCRICRGESTNSESLFYPCRCSGSIKYVHQDCLMEWLSHSQKKYCELCKTPFRFTKLYHPQMPKTLPTRIFVKMAFLHLLSWMGTWARAFLVFFVWVVCLPYIMRVVWRALFWVGDGAWSRNEQMELYLQGMGNATTPTMTQDATPSPTNASATGLLKVFSQAMISRTINATAKSMVGLFFGQLFTLGIIAQPYKPPQNSTGADFKVEIHRKESILSEMDLFRNMTTSPLLDRIIVDVLEGIMITLGVVFAFILVFLIREWVVQQQPLANMQVAINIPLPAPEAEVAGIENADGEADDEGGDGDADSTDADRWSYGDAHSIVHRDESDDEAEDEASRRARSVKRGAEQTIADLPTEVRAAVRAGRLSEVVEIVTNLPEDEARRVKQLISHWKENLAEPSQQVEGQSKELIRVANAIESGEPSSSRRPVMPLRDPPFEAIDVLRGMEEESGEGRASTNESGQKIPDWWEDEMMAAERSLALPSADKGKGRLIDAGDSSHKKAATISGEEQEEDRDDSPQRTLAYLRAAREAREQARKEVLGQHDALATESNNDGQSATPEDSNGTIERTLGDSAASTTTGDAKLNEASELEPRQLGRTAADRQAEIEAEERVMVAMGMTEGGGIATDLDEAALGLPSESAISPGSVVAAKNKNLLERILDYFYGDLQGMAPVAPDVLEGDDEHVVQDINDEAPFVPFEGNQPALNQQDDQDPEVAAAAAEAGIDINNPDDMDDAEDLEGILELIGMQGPISGLFQNALFSCLLIATTVMTVVWIPYVWGKLMLLVISTPLMGWLALPFEVVIAMAGFLADICLTILGFIWATGVWTTMAIYRLSMGMSPYAAQPLPVYAETARIVASEAWGRLGNMSFVGILPSYHVLRMSMLAHASLKDLKAWSVHSVASIGNTTGGYYAAATSERPFSVCTMLYNELLRCATGAWDTMRSVKLGLSVLYAHAAAPLSLSSETAERVYPPFDPALAFWSIKDRTATILLAYASFAMIGCIYLSFRTPISSKGRIRRFEKNLAEILVQAGGVFKVILIISIEMIVFPLFCGFLLDVALLPLFEDASVPSRVAFTVARPWTSGFVHWFVGTCYMFHFALFVSMCRKIMRPGVLYFIRDPDDPTFHPVRDVLERSVATQLKKIAFSALVYGTLIVVCLGGVVWGLCFLCPGVLPLHWSSSKSALEFPLDLLFYNFFTPLVLKSARPSDGLHAMYKWWFRRCARFLRISHFLFGVRKMDEERNMSGRHVFAPGSDQLRIPKGEPTFVELDVKTRPPTPHGEVEIVPHMIHRKFVYIPPWFKVRISAFVVLIWLFAAVTGCGITVVPLIVGRSMCLAFFAKKEQRVNDIYAFSLGIYTLGGLLYFGLNGRKIYHWASRKATSIRDSNLTSSFIRASTKISHYTLRALRIIYVYGALTISLPLAFAAIIELYFIIPLHTLTIAGGSSPFTLYTNLTSTNSSAVVSLANSTVAAIPETARPHTVHLVQDWTLGILYCRLLVRLSTLITPTSLISLASASVVQHGGYLNPSARLATRYFIVPLSLVFAAALLVPLAAAAAVNATVFGGEGPQFRMWVYRASYPATAWVGVGVWIVWRALGQMERWSGRIRDEVYLIGERLHNFGEKRKVSAALPAAPAVGVGKGGQVAVGAGVVGGV